MKLLRQEENYHAGRAAEVERGVLKTGRQGFGLSLPPELRAERLAATTGRDVKVATTAGPSGVSSARHYFVSAGDPAS